jgi:hypothetical protein
VARAGWLRRDAQRPSGVSASHYRYVALVGHSTAADVQCQHAPALLTGRLRAERRWGRPCLAYHACIQPGPDARARLSVIQESVLNLEPSLLRVPERALHANLAWLLPVHQEFDRPKDELWQRHGPEWMAILDGIVGTAESFRLRFRHLVATDSAVIAVAGQPNRLSALRRELMSALSVPGSLSAGELVHMTLFRYAGPLRDPATLIRRLAAGTCVGVDVREVLVVREHIFPSLDYEVLRRIPLVPADPVESRRAFDQ